MRKIFAVGLILGLWSCTNHKPAENQSRPLLSEYDTFMLANRTISIDTATAADFSSIKGDRFETDDAIGLAKDSTLARRSGDTLFLRLSNGLETKMVNDTSDGESAVEYHYVRYFKNINQFVIYGIYYEWYLFTLVDGTTGDKITMWGLPVVSPDNKLVISGNLDLEAQFTSNGFQLFEFQNKRLKLIGERELVKWGPEEIRWKSNNELIIKRSMPDTTHKREEAEKQDYIKLTIK